MEQDERVLFELADVEMSYGGSAMAPEGRGLLQVTSKCLLWKQQQQEEGVEGKVYKVDAPCITLHAISKDPSSFPKPCLYCQVSEGGEDEDEDEAKEIYFVPQDPESLSPLFEALSKAALMNPDPPEAEENEGDDDLIFDQSAFAAAGGASEEQARVLSHLEGLMTFSPNLGAAAGGQFDDVEEEEEEGTAAAAAATDGESERGGAGEEEEGAGGMNGHNGIAQ